MTTPAAKVGIISIGQMGLGIARLLQAHNCHVMTNVSGRSPATQQRVRDAHLESVSTDTELLAKSDYILSIVPPRDALATARRFIEALNTTPAPREGISTPLYYLELNAISPSTVSSIAAAFKENAPEVRFVDGGIIGGPPMPLSGTEEWKCPGIPLSGPYALHKAPVAGAHLATVLNTKYLGSSVGAASGLKCCFAAISKGFIALILQSFSTAASLQVLPALQHYLAEFNPQGAERAEKGIISCPSKAYRWIEEMHQIGDCFAEEGGWGSQAKVFREIAGVYDKLADLVDANGGTKGFEDVDGVVGNVMNAMSDRLLLSHTTDES